jgi:hypothetical protein
MKKFKKEFKLNDDNKFVDFISNTIETYLDGDWNEYEVGEEVVYSIDIRDEEDIIDLKDINFDSLFEFVGEGICLVHNSDDDLWYNIEIKDNILLISYEYLNEEEDYEEEDYEEEDY